MKQKQLTIVVPNSAGTLAEVTGLLADEGVNIENVCAYSTGDVAVLHLLTDDNTKARNVLDKENLWMEEVEVIKVQMWNRPGALSAVTSKFRQHAISLQYVYGTSSSEGEKMTMIFSAEDNEKAAEVFDMMVLEEAQKFF